MQSLFTTAETEKFYRAALALLQFVEKRQPTQRRWGGEADALWTQLRGDLTTADRIDLLLRDADVQWPGAFGARTVFALGGVADDEPFGSEWPGLDGERAEELWRTIHRVAAGDATATLRSVGAPWKLELTAFEAPSIDAADAFVVAGPSAVAALVRAFEGRPELDWAAQVTLIASSPGHRQIAAAAGALLNITSPVTILAADQELPSGRRAGTLVLSADAAVEDAERARALAGEQV